MRLVDNWQRCLRWFSVQLHLAATSVIFVLMLAPASPIDLNAVLPPPWGIIATVAWAVLGLLARIVDQKKREKPHAE